MGLHIFAEIVDHSVVYLLTLGIKWRLLGNKIWKKSLSLPADFSLRENYNRKPIMANERFLCNAML